MSNSIVGAKKKERKPRIAVDSAASVSTAKLLYGLAEGEVYGLADGAKSIRLDGTPLLDDNGNGNFNGVRWTFAAGTNDQEHISGFPDVTNEIGVGVELRSDNPWIKAFNDTQLSAVRVRFKWGRLSKTNPDNGDVNGYTIKYAIDLQTDGGAYHEIINTKIQEKTSAGYERTHRIDLPKAKTGWQLRVRRLTPNSTSEYVQDTMMVDAVAEVIDVKLSYPNTALLGIEYNAEIFSSVAKIAVRVKGKIIRVPDNYDPVARTYTGIWTGNFKDAYSNNPAWVFYDLCTQWRGGLGERLDATMIDRWSLYTLGQYCDQPVSDGQGGLEPRFTCNVYLQKQEEAYTVLQNIAGIFRAMSFWTGERIMLDADVPQDSIYTYSSANIVGGVAGVQYSGTRNRDRHTLAKVAWDNPNNDYQTEYEYIRDEKAMSKFGVKVLDLSAFGCTSQAQAQRAGLWALKTEQLETRQVTFSVGLDGAIPRVGNIISLSDEAFAGRANGGRVSTVNSTQRIIELDREVTASVGDVLIINGGSGKSERRNISNVVGNRITVTAGFTSAEPEHVWAIETADLKLMRFRVMSITENDDATYAITAIQHEPQKYDAIDFGTDVKPTEITIVNPDTVDAPDTVNIESRHREVQGQTVTTLVISWAQVSGAVAYDVEWRKDDGTWIKLPRTGNVSAEIEGVYSGNYLARVRSVSAFDVQSQATTSILTEVKGKVGLPPTVVGLTATGVLFGMDLKWGFQAGSGDAAFTEIQVGSAPNVNVATLTQVSYPTNTHAVTGLQGNLKQSYRARIVDKLGLTSVWSAWVTGTTDNSVDKVMDLIQGQIDESSLNQALTSKIEKIETNSSSIDGIDTELDKAKADIAAADKVIAANKAEAANAVAAANAEVTKAKADIVEANKTIADNKLIASNAVAAANAEIAASKVIIDSNKAEISEAKTELNTAKTQLATAIEDIGAANTEIADSKLLIDANKAKLVLTDAEVAAAKTKVTALETDYNGNKTSVSNALAVLTDKDKSLASDLSTLTASYGASEAKLVQDLKVLADKDVALTNSVTTLSSNYEANKAKVATDITTLADKDTALNNLLTTLDSEYEANKASVSSSLTTLTNKDTALASDISSLNTKTDNTNAEIATVKNLVSDNTSSIATTKTELTTAYKQAIDDIEIGGRNYFSYSEIKSSTLKLNSYGLWGVQLEPDSIYTFHCKGMEATPNNAWLRVYEGDYTTVSPYWLWVGQTTKDEFSRKITTDESGMLWLSWYGRNPSDIVEKAQIFKGTVLQDWAPAPEDVEADYTAAISTESVARADADKVITSSVTTLKSDYDANKASVTSSLSTLTDKDTALTSQLTDLTSTVGTNTANITNNHSTLVAEDKAIADSVTALDTKYEDNKTSVSNQLIALVNKDTATANQLTALDTDYKDNKTTVSNSLTALSDKDTALGSSITDLTAIVDTNTASISAEATARADADKVITSSVTTLKSDYDANKASVTNSLSTLTSKDTAFTNSIDALTTRVGTAEGTITSNNTALVNKDKALTDSLNALTTDYNGNKTTVSNSLSALSTADTALGNRITATDAIAKDAQSRVGTAETAISNNTGAIATTKTDITAAYKQAIDDIEIGGRNLLSNSQLLLFNSSDSGNGNSCVVIDDYVSVVFKKYGNIYASVMVLTSPILAGEYYTVSVDIKSDNPITSLLFYSGGAHIPSVNYTKTGEWQRVSATILQASDRAKGSRFLGGFTRVGAGTVLQYKNFKLEKGNKVTDWSPAPEDTTDYVDKGLADAKTTSEQYAAQKANEALAAANDNTATKADEAQDAAEKYALAKAKAEADAALVLAKSDATTKANAAKSEAEATAALDAKNKADKALADAKLDATAKANAAKTYADGIVKSLKTEVDSKATITQLNTVKNNANQALATAKTELTGSYTKAIEEINVDNTNYFPYEFLSKPENWIRGTYYTADIRVQLEPNTVYTIRIGELLPFTGQVVFNVIDGTAEDIRYGTSGRSILTSVFNVRDNTIAREVTKHFTTPDSGKISFDIYSLRYINPDIIKKVQINKGAEATPWAPSYLDAALDINRVEQSLLTLVDSKASISRVDTVENNATKALATAKTDLTGSYTSAISKAKGESATDAQTKANEAERLAKVHADNKVSELKTIVDSKASISRVDTVENDAEKALAAAKTELTSSYTEAIDNIEIGGRNLFQQSNYSKHIHGGTINNGTTSAVLKVEPNTTYTISYTVTVSNRFGIYQGNLPDGDISKSFTDRTTVIGYITATTGTKINRTFTTGSAGEFIYIYLSYGIGQVKEPYLKVEKGNKATDWSPAPEDTEASISTESKARSDADTALGNRITTLDTDYKGNKTAIRNELTAVSNKTNSTATSLGTLTTTVGGNTTKISQESTARSTADTALGNRITATDAIAKNAQSRVGTAETAISNATSAIATLRTDLTASYNIQDTRGTNELPSYYYTNFPRQTVREFKQKSVMTGVVGSGTYVYLETVVRWSSVSGGAIVQTAVTDDNRIYIRTSSSASAWRAWKEQENITGSAAKVAALKTALDKDIKATDARVTAEKKVAADATSAVASTVGALTTTVNGHTSSIQTQQTTINGLKAQYTVKLDVGGRVSGFGLASSTTQSDFAVNADKFYIAPPTGSSKGTSPFMVLTSPRTINGTSVPAGTYIESAFIHNGSIDTLQVKDGAIKTAQIDNLAVTTGKIANLAVDTAQIANGAIETAKIANLSVDTLKIKGYAVTEVYGSYIVAHSYFGWPPHSYHKATIDVSSEATVIINVSLTAIKSRNGAPVRVRLYRDADIIKTWHISPNGSVHNHDYWVAEPIIDQNFAGEREYSITLSTNGEANYHEVSGSTLIVQGAKK